jgi:hypothetical protein
VIVTHGVENLNLHSFPNPLTFEFLGTVASLNVHRICSNGKSWKYRFFGGLVWLMLYAHRHRSILGAAGHIILTPANQLMEE